MLEVHSGRERGPTWAARWPDHGPEHPGMAKQRGTAVNGGVGLRSLSWGSGSVGAVHVA